jgi:hypothetical protein
MNEVQGNRRVIVTEPSGAKLQAWTLAPRGIHARRVMIVLRQGEKGTTTSRSWPSAGVLKAHVRLDRGYEVFVPTAELELARKPASSPARHEPTP